MLPIIYQDSTGTKAFSFQSTNDTIEPTKMKQETIAILIMPFDKFAFDLTLLYLPPEASGFADCFNSLFL